MYVSPNNPHHRKLESDVEGWLRSQGFVVSTNAYHDRQTADFVDLIKRCDDRTALAVRTTSDRIAVYHDAAAGVESFKVEFKTIPGGRENLAMEALPLALHRRHVSLGVRCLYVVRDPNDGRRYEGGFWVSGRPLPNAKLYITDRFRDMGSDLAGAFPECRVVYRAETDGGSNDPFVVVPRHCFDELMTRDWRGLVLPRLPCVHAGLFDGEDIPF